MITTEYNNISRTGKTYLDLFIEDIKSNNDKNLLYSLIKEYPESYGVMNILHFDNIYNKKQPKDIDDLNDTLEHFFNTILVNDINYLVSIKYNVNLLFDPINKELYIDNLIKWTFQKIKSFLIYIQYNKQYLINYFNNPNYLNISGGFFGYKTNEEINKATEKLKKIQNDIRKERHKQKQEDFTPVKICHKLFEGQEELFKNFVKTFCDPCCGKGNIIRYLVRERLKYCETKSDVYKALSSIYGTELMEDNTLECRQKILYDCLEWSSEHNIDLEDKKIMKILKNNIVCTDTFKWDYENWVSLESKKEPI